LNFFTGGGGEETFGWLFERQFYHDLALSVGGGTCLVLSALVRFTPRHRRFDRRWLPGLSTACRSNSLETARRGVSFFCVH